MITCYLIRHGTTTWVDAHRIHGITDVPLNEDGINQAKEVSKALKGIRADFLYASPLSRAFKTAEIIGQELNLVPNPVEDMKEMNFGWMEGKEMRDGVFDVKPSLATRLYHYYENIVYALSGETEKQFDRRILKSWQNVQNLSQGKNFVLVVHAAVINRILNHYFGKRYLNGEKFYMVHPASITELVLSKTGKAELVRLDDYAHLKAWFADED